MQSFYKKSVNFAHRNMMFVIIPDYMSKVFNYVVLVLFFCFISASADAQELQVKSFGPSPNSTIASANPRNDKNGTPCAALIVRINCDDVTFEDDFLLEQKKVAPGEYLLYMGSGARKLMIYVPGFLPFEVRFPEHNKEYYELKTKQDYILIVTSVVNVAAPSKKFSSSFYLDAGFFVSSVLGPQISLGANLADFNVQFDAIIPVGSAQPVCWNHPSLESEQCSYKPSFSFAGRLGYGIRLGNKIRLTPQLGLRFLKTSETLDEGTVQHASGAYVTSLLIAARLQYAFSKHIGVCLAPEYAIPILKSDGFKALADASSKISGWNNGIGASLSLNIEF